MKRRLSVTNLSSENNLPMLHLNAAVVIRVKVKKCEQTLLFTHALLRYTSLEVWILRIVLNRRTPPPQQGQADHQLSLHVEQDMMRRQGGRYNPHRLLKVSPVALQPVAGREWSCLLSSYKPLADDGDAFTYIFDTLLRMAAWTSLSTGSPCTQTCISILSPII